jgi:hypothetical protein
MGWGGGGCGEGGSRQAYCLSDQNFSPVLPCSNGECLKIVRLENGSLSEIVSCFLETMAGKGVPAGSVIILFSAAHLQMRGVAGYMADLATELSRLNNAFRGGIVSLPGIPVLLGGFKDKTAVRAIMEAGRWLSHSGSFHLQETMKMVMSGVTEMGQGGV